MEKINFQDGTRTSRAKVTIDGVDYIVTPAQFSGATPLSAYVMNRLQTNVENSINQNADNIGGKEYDDTKTYDIGDIVKYQGQLYICIETIDTAEEFDDTKWAETDVLSSAGGNEIAIGSSSDITGKTKIYVEEATQRLKYKDSTTGQFTDIAGDEVFVGEEQNIPDSTKLWIDTDELLPENSEVVNSLAGNETTKAPSVRAVNDSLTASMNNIFTVNSGYTIKNQNIYKQGNHYFGYLVVSKNNGNFNDDVIGALSVKPKDTINFGCFISTYEWSTTAVGYLYINSNNGNIIVSGDGNIAKIYLDFIV